MDWYDAIKCHHTIGSIALFGTAFQMVMAMRNGDPNVMATVARNVVIADWVFTTSATNKQPLCKKCLRYYRIWFTLGWPAFIALTGIFWLMITKPQF